jgi:hypothetical protein
MTILNVMSENTTHDEILTRIRTYEDYKKAAKNRQEYDFAQLPL